MTNPNHPAMTSLAFAFVVITITYALLGFIS